MDEDFLQGLTGRVVVPSDPIYPEARQGFNRAVQRYPLIINYCATAQDVANAVRWSRLREVPLRVRGGGHNYAGYSNGDCVLIIDTGELQDIAVDESAGTVRVGAGVKNRELYETISSLGYPFPGGTCPTVGVAGYAMGGGWGLTCRTLGLGCDSLLSLEVIDDNGNLITASESENEELFWACRGAGDGNFGAIVSLTFRLPAKVALVTLVEIEYDDQNEPAQRDFLHAWQQWLEGADPRMSLIGRVYNDAEFGLGMLARGIFFGRSQEAEAILQPFLALSPTVVSIQELTFLEAIRIIMSGYPAYELFTSFSRFVLDWLTDEQIEQAVQTIQQPAPGSVLAGLSLYALGGQVARTAVDDTAFYYRKAKYILYLTTDWEDGKWAALNRVWLAQRYPVLGPLGAGAYVNFPWAGLPCFLRQYYGEHVQRLQVAKRQYDPCNVFTYPQGIEPEAEPLALPFPCPQTEPDSTPNSEPLHYNHREFRHLDAP